MMRKFGEGLSKILVNLEEGIWDHEADFPNDKPDYTEDGFRAATKIFMSTLMDKMWEYQEREKLPIDWRLKMAETYGQKIRNMIKEATGLDMWEIYDRKFEQHA